MATKFGLTASNGKLFNLFNLIFQGENENTIPCLRKLASTKITMKAIKHLIIFSMVSTTRRILQKKK